MTDYKPMLLSSREQPFDDSNFIFEIKFDGVRCIAQLDGKTILTGRSGKDFTLLFPELADMHIFCNNKCVLDGEIAVLTDGTPDFVRVLSRTSGSAKTVNTASLNPAVFIAFDILELNSQPLVSLPLIKRKEILDQTLSESAFVKKCPFIIGEGKKIYDFALQNKLEGIVAKRKTSLYRPGKRTTDWLKIKPLKTEKLTIFGYIPEENSDNVRDLILGYFNDAKAVFKTKIYAGHKTAETKRIKEFAVNNKIITPYFSGFPSAVWLKPDFLCVIEYLEETKSGLYRHAVFKSLL